jgi:3'-phosphoadenosine 5'-phosphosulfate sulfotransferase (PAPS reductase)/FAD synthetase
MSKKQLRHLLGISGGKDSAALAIYLHNKYPEINFEYYFCDTGKELDETYSLIVELENYLGKKVKYLNAANNSHLPPFDHFLRKYDGFLPASNARWCTKNLKLEPFEKFVGDDPVISYVAIRGDEDREGYISTKPNIQTVFPFRRSIWSLEVLSHVLNDQNIEFVAELYKKHARKDKLPVCLEVVYEPKSSKMSFSRKLNMLLDLGISIFNKVVFETLQNTEYPISLLDFFPLVDNEDIINKQDVFDLFKKYGVSIPKYYNEVEFTVNGQKGKYNRTRSGCYFCFYQQKIEWVWLYEQHPKLFKMAMVYEKEGYTWNENESLADLIKPDRIKKIKEDYIKRKEHKANSQKSDKLVDILADNSGISCVNCFI